MKKIAIALVVLLAAAYGGVKYYLYYNTSEGMKSVVQMLSPIMSITYGGISSTLGGEVAIDDLQILIFGYRDEITIKSLGITTPSLFDLLELSKTASGKGSGKMPEFIGVFVESARLESGADYYRDYFDQLTKAAGANDLDQPRVKCSAKYGAFSPEALLAMGYDEQIVSFSVTVRQSDSEFVIEITSRVDDMADTDMLIALGGNMMTEMSRGRSYTPRLSNLRISYTDHSLIAKMNKYCASLGLTPEQTLASHLDSLQYQGMQYGIEFDEYVVEPYKALLAGKSNLVITAKPRRLIDFNEIPRYNPKDVGALLNLEAVAQ